MRVGSKSAWAKLGEHPGYVLMRAAARFSSVRNACVAVQGCVRPSLAKYLRGIEMRRSLFFPGKEAREVARAVERDAYALGLDLAGEHVNELRRFADNEPCFVDRNPTLGFMARDVARAREKLGQPFLQAQYFNLRKRSELIRQLSDDPLLVATAARYLGTPPKLIGVNLFWSYPAQVSNDKRSYAAQLFHFDLDDFKFIKFFFYLTDVDMESGPHVLVRSSHHIKRYASLGDRLKVRRYSDEEILSAYGADRIVTITGPAGTGYAEDTLCIHKGLPPAAKDRLILQIQYAINDWGTQHDEIGEADLVML